MDFPMLNARLDGEEIVQFSSAHIALAVDTERGLLAPILRDVQAKSLRQVARESSLLIEKARGGQISYEDLQGATFTITNLGMFEIDAFTPIIDLPQCAILGVGRILAKQVVMDFEKGVVALRQCATISLTFDHRLNDGAGAARFLQRIKRYIENPYLWLVGI
jgi:pyruvate dehydrogenase E2 component (dihydrolipoamide acetyltransferase)